jgi:hypothetical protein
LSHEELAISEKIDKKDSNLLAGEITIEQGEAEILAHYRKVKNAVA